MAAITRSQGVLFTDNGAIYTLGNGNVIDYKRINGIYYHGGTPNPVVQVLERARLCRDRVRIYYGDTETGRDWLEEFDVEGFIGNSIGPLKVPLLICNRRCSGGPALLDHCIVKIKAVGRKGGILYQHADYHTGVFTIREIRPNDKCGGLNLSAKGYTHAVDVDGKNHANFRGLKAAEWFVQNMTG